jgi:hypothetical protein
MIKTFQTNEDIDEQGFRYYARMKMIYELEFRYEGAMHN